MEEQIMNTPADGGTTQNEERTFTQDEVNRIIQDRLARVKDKAETPDSEKVQDIINRENKLNCREYILNQGYPSVLLDILDTSNSEAFQASADKLIEAFPQLKPEIQEPGGTGSIGNFSRHRPDQDSLFDKQLENVFLNKE